jgi:hypothetical protein
MSKIKELVLDIEYLLNEGKSFVEVARELEIPVHFVVEATEIIHQQELEEDCSPFATINS